MLIASCDIYQVCTAYTVMGKPDKLSCMLIHKGLKFVAERVLSGRLSLRSRAYSQVKEALIDGHMPGKNKLILLKYFGYGTFWNFTYY
jgi:hypothetical protein